MKKYQKIFAFLIVFMFLGTSWFYYDNYVKVSGIVKVSARENIKSNSSISMMYETSAGSGEYTETTESKWPSGGYKFNATLSKCEKDSYISWDAENKKVIISANRSDRCYVYFDKIIPPIIENVSITKDSTSINAVVSATKGDNEIKQYHYYLNNDLKSTTINNSYTYSGLTKATPYEVVIVVEDTEGNLSKVYSTGVTTDNITLLADYIKSQYTTDGVNSLYLHDADLVNGANDGSYRYAGASEDVNNYVCFASDAETCPDDNLYRIIGVFGDQVKLIKYDYATSAQLGTDGEYIYVYAEDLYYYKGTNFANVASYYWDYINETNIWANSALNTVNLNTNYIEYLNGINTKWANMIAETTWKVGGNTTANIRDVAMNVAYQNEIVNPVENTTYTDEIGLMYVSDYGYAASPTYWTYPGYSSSGASNDYRAATGSNWIYMGLNDWTITRSSDYSEFSQFAFIVCDTGDVFFTDVFFDAAVRPSFSLKSTIGYSGVGDGTKQNPYRLS